MKSNLLWLLLLLAVPAKSQTPDCTRFKTGTFIYSNLPGYGYTIRDKKKQRSFVMEKNMWVTWSVKWKSECSFELTFESAENSDEVFGKGDRILITITSVEGDCYTFSSRYFSGKDRLGKILPQSQMCLKKD